MSIAWRELGGASVALALLASTGFGQTRAKRIVPVSPAETTGFEQSRKIALLAGVGRYPGYSGIGQLQYPARDAGAVAEQLKKQGYTVIELTDAEATREAIRGALRNIGRVLGGQRDGTLAFFFSGHGWAPAGAGGPNILATFDAGAANLSGSGLAIEEVLRLMAETGAKRRVAWIDACRNEPGKSGPGSTRTFAALNRSEGTRVLFSTRFGELSYESAELKQGVFSHFLVKALAGDAARADGLLTFGDVREYVSESVQAWGLKTGELQIPYEAGESSGDFLLGRAPAAVAAPKVDSPSAETAGWPKVLVIHIQQAIASTAEGQRAVRYLENKADPQKRELERMKSEIADLDGQLARNPTQGTRARREQLARDFEAKAEAASAWLNSEQGRILEDMGSKMMTVIDKICRDSGTDLVIDISSPETSVVYAPNPVDVTAIVVKAYDSGSTAAAAAESRQIASVPVLVAKTAGMSAADGAAILNAAGAQANSILLQREHKDIAAASWKVDVSGDIAAKVRIQVPSSARLGLVNLSQLPQAARGKIANGDAGVDLLFDVSHGTSSILWASTRMDLTKTFSAGK
jgi:Skp family chaperone for outer membrane proteins